MNLCTVKFALDFLIFIKWKIYLRKIFNLVLAPNVCIGKANCQIRYSNKNYFMYMKPCEDFNHTRIPNLIFDNWSSKKTKIFRIFVLIYMNKILVHGWYLLHNILQCFDIFKHGINEWAYRKGTFLLLSRNTSKPLVSLHLVGGGKCR